MVSALCLLAIIMEATEDDEPVLVQGHSVARARIWAAPARQLLPGIAFQVQPPEIPVVLELLLPHGQRHTIWTLACCFLESPHYGRKYHIKERTSSWLERE